jgi:hypothetical protein
MPLEEIANVELSAGARKLAGLRRQDGVIPE